MNDEDMKIYIPKTTTTSSISDDDTSDVRIYSPDVAHSEHLP